MSSPTNPNMAADLPPIGLRRVVYLQANRAPTVLDSKYRDGSYYEFNTEWRDLSKTPPQIWKLAAINSRTDAVWFLMGPGGGPPASGAVLQFTTSTDGNVVLPNALTGNVNLTAGPGISITGTVGPETVTIGLTGGGASIDQIAVQAATAPGVTPVNPDGTGLVTVNGSVVAAHAVPIETRTRALNAYNVEVQRAASSATTDATSQGLASFKTSQFTTDASGWVSLAGGTGPALLTMSDDVSASVSPSGTGNIQLVGHVVEAGATKFSTIVAGTNLLNINPMSPARWIVDPLGFNGTHTTISSAITSATSGDTIFILPGTYSDALTLKAGVNLSAFPCDAYTPNVIISGNVTASYNGNVSCSGINFKAASGVSIACSGASSSTLELVDCTVSATNGTGITVNGANFVVYVEHCVIAATAGNACFTLTTGFITSRRSTFGAGDSTANTATGTFNAYQSDFSISIATSGAGTINAFQCTFNNSGNTTPITTAGTGISITSNCYFNAGTASALSIGAGTTLFVMNASVVSSNANAIAGAGTLKYGYIVFGGTSSTIAGGVTSTALTVI